MEERTEGVVMQEVTVKKLRKNYKVTKVTSSPDGYNPMLVKVGDIVEADTMPIFTQEGFHKILRVTFDVNTKV